MQNNTAIEVMLNAMNKERTEVYGHLKQIDKIIKSLKAGDMSAISGMNFKQSVTAQNDLFNTPEPENTPPTIFKGDAKMMILKIFDNIGKACKLKQVQEQYAKLTGSNLNIREPLRALNKAKKVKLMKEKTASRGIYWVKNDWIEDLMLLDEYKPDGFDLLYDADNLEYI